MREHQWSQGPNLSQHELVSLREHLLHTLDIDGGPRLVPGEGQLWGLYSGCLQYFALALPISTDPVILSAGLVVQYVRQEGIQRSPFSLRVLLSINCHIDSL